MCGIAGIFKFNSVITTEDVEAVQRMMDAQVHRGPDDSGLYQNKDIVLGHRRLSIIDLSEAGKQPMSNEDGTVWMTYNGEIYNFKELYAELVNSGHLFRSKTDTEVLVHGYEEWGIEGLLFRLHGMFAFVIYDKRFGKDKERLVLARDRFGIKPLYYYKDRERLIFSSEVKSMARSKIIPLGKNHEAFISFLIFGSVPSPLTTIRNISSLPPASYLLCESKKEKIIQYYKLEESFAKPKQKDDQNVYSTLRHLFAEVVNAHLISDAPLGVFLSGGIDSSALVALSSQNRDRPITTLSIVFDEKSYNELPYQRMVSEKFKTDHKEIKITREDFYDEIDKIFDAMDQPTVDGINTYFISKAAKQAGLKAVLSGLGGDEVFCGYDSFKRINFLKNLGKLPRTFKYPFLFAKNFNDRLRKLSYLSESDDLSLYLTLRGLFIPKDVAKILNVSEKEIEDVISRLTANIYRSPLLDPVDWLSAMEISFYLQNQLLKDSDFMSMRHSVEIRVPFLSHRLIDYVSSVPKRMKFSQAMNKPLLIGVLDHRLPIEVWDRPKKGFVFPFGEWMKEREQEIREKTNTHQLFNRKAVDSIWKRFVKGNIHWSRAWAPIVAGRFDRMF